MAFSKADRYDPEEQHVGNYCGAFNHPARQRILKQLKREGMMTVEEINKEHPLSENTMSFHIRTLRLGGLISARVEYPYINYQINIADIKRAREAINAFLDLLLKDEIE